MNKKQKIILIAFILVLITMLLFPPTYFEYPNKRFGDTNYEFIITFIVKSNNNIHINLYVIQIVLVSMIFGLLFILNKD